MRLLFASVMTASLVACGLDNVSGSLDGLGPAGVGGQAAGGVSGSSGQSTGGAGAGGAAGKGGAGQGGAGQGGAGQGGAGAGGTGGGGAGAGGAGAAGMSGSSGQAGMSPGGAAGQAGASGAGQGGAGMSGGGGQGGAGVGGQAGAGQGGAGAAGGAVCGNGVVEAGEGCDVETPVPCAEALQKPDAVGVATCTNACQFDLGGCQFCGDAKRNLGEECDGGDFGATTCALLNGPGAVGTLGCSAACQVDASGCSSCTNGKLDGQETDQDCGGPCPVKCPPLGACQAGSDCLTGYCAADKKCREALCGSGQVDGQETDTDCGGPSCVPCLYAKKCRQLSDCQAGPTSTCLGDRCLTKGDDVAVSTKACAPGATLFQGHCYTAVGSSAQASWYDALTQCKALGGHLAVLETAAEFDYIAKTFGLQDGNEYWVGYKCANLQDCGSADFYSWLGGGKASYDPWVTGGPNGVTSHCARFIKGANGWRLDDQSCNLLKVGYICEQGS